MQPSNAGRIVSKSSEPDPESLFRPESMQVAGSAQRSLNTNALLLSSAPAVTKVTGSTGGFLASLFGGSKAPALPPLYDPLPGVRLPPPLVAPSSLETTVSTLSNGLKIASEDTPGCTTTVGLYIDCGSIYESDMNSGASHLLEKMAFKSTSNRTHFRIVREVEAIGGHVSASASREQMAYTADGLKTFLPEMLELLADCVRNPVFHDWEVKEQMAKVQAEVKEMNSNPQNLLLECLHSTGYAGALGNSLLAPEMNVGNLNSDVLYEFVQRNYQAPRMVLAAAGADHEELRALADPLFADMAGGALSEAPPSKYLGGDWRAGSNNPLTHVAMAFEIEGGWRNEKDALAVSVLQTLMGGGGSFSAGGPGKGMHSRLYTRVLNKHAWVQSCTAFSSIYNDSGLVGIYATANSDSKESVVDLMCHELLAVASPNGVTEVELRRAKNATISSVLMNLESRVVVTEDIGRQILTYGHRKQPSEFISAVKELTVKDITDVAQKILNTPLTMASHGNVLSIPQIDVVASRFG